MTALTFRQSAGCPQIYPADDPASPGGQQLLFLLPRGAAAAAQLDLPATWAASPVGCFIFLPAALPSDQHAAFAAAAWNFLEDRRRQGARVAWFENPGE